MQHWLIATLEGAILGLTLYCCVRLRMYIGPKVRERFGNLARRAYWLLTILLMIVLANVGLLIFRIYLSSQSIAAETLYLELWFGLVALGVGIAMIFRRLSPNH